MAQLFSNNVDTQLSAPLTNVDTSATLADGSGLNTPTGGDYELLTLIAGTDVEIVRMTARTGNTITITRAQEGTTAIAWGTGARIFADVTAGSLAGMFANQSTASQAVAVGAGSEAGANSVAVGYEAVITGVGATGVGLQCYADENEAAAFGLYAWAASPSSVAVGPNAHAGGMAGAGTAAVAIGSAAGADGAGGVAVGASSGADGLNSVAAGAQADVSAARGIAIGWQSDNDGADGIAIGQRAWVTGADGVAVGSDSRSVASAVAIGADAYARKANTAHIAALPTVQGATVAAANCAWLKNAAEVVIMSDPVSLTAASVHTIPMPTDVTFYPNEVGVIVTAADTVTGQPTVRFGATGAETRYLTATETVGLTAVRAREKFATLASDEGSTTLAAEITIAGAATTLTGQFYWRGFAVEQ